MQPYFFPYAGYYQLIANVDMFVFLDDVQYIRRGWVNRNKIRKSAPIYITVPVKKSPRETSINQIQISLDWVPKHLKTFTHIFSQKIRDSEVYKFYTGLSQWKLLSPMLCESIQWMSKYLGLKTQFDYASRYPSSRKGQDRILELCKQLGATSYVNLPGGKRLYDEKEFGDVELVFLDTDHHERISILETYFNGTASSLRF